ncbi:MAG: sigma-70 family RNA polymerase sigma factor [Candidatus Latescibacteria bacterium]|nr:sigma-70 family RNA polymerase sigma factor [Candidatus Latescibacterota bacterium]
MDDFQPREYVERCLAGETEAFEPLVRHYQNAAFATALRYVSARVEAQDIVQDALVTAYCRLGQLRDRARFGGWLMHIVANRCRDWLRQRNRQQPLETAAWVGEEAALAEHARQMRRLDLQAAIQGLPEHYRQAVLMYYLSGLSYREIADSMDVPQSTVRGRLQQGRLRLRRLLDPAAQQEEIDMPQIDVSQQVQEVVCQIATRQIKQEISLQDTDHIVFNCAVDGELEIRQADGDQAVLEGTLSSFAPTLEQARQSLDGIAVEADQVDDFLSSGPHEGEVFLGTSEKDGHITAAVAGTGQLWRNYLEGKHMLLGLHQGLQTGDLFPYMENYKLPVALRESLGRATRVTVLRREVEDILLSKAAFTPQLQRIFRPNSVNDGQVHGSVGFASLVLLVPRGKRVTVIKGNKVRACGLQGSISFIVSTCEEVADIEGDVALFDSTLATARNIGGKLSHRDYQYSGMHWSDDGALAHRHERADCRLENIGGPVDIDVGGAQIEALGLQGGGQIYNRYGQTRLHQVEADGAGRTKVETCSGDIRLFLKESRLGQTEITVFTLCGRIEYEALKGRGLHRSNNNEAVMLATHSKIFDADFVLKSESGPVIIEKTI